MAGTASKGLIDHSFLLRRIAAPGFAGIPVVLRVQWSH
ncbi:MAG: hypothetical protein ACI8RN_003020 [Glaciecola sp.]